MAPSIEFHPHPQPAGQFAGPPIRIGVQGGEVVLTADGERGVELPGESLPGAEHVLGWLGDRPCVAVDLDGWELPETLRRVGLRQLHGLVPEEIWGVAGRAVQVVAFEREHRYCGRCAAPTQPDPRERVRRCPNCGLAAYPRVSPAIIVLVTRGERDQRALLAWGRRRETPFYSLIAGFVEPGEDLEHAVAREVLEETAIEVADMGYRGSQPWPFPNQLMIGFRARYAGGEIEAQKSEIVEARWFSPSEARQAPTARGSFSIAGQLIDDWLAEQDGG